MSDFDWPTPVARKIQDQINRALSTPTVPGQQVWFTGTPMGLHPLAVCGTEVGGERGAGQPLGPGDRCPACGTTVPPQSPDGFPTDSCRSCEAPIVWATTEGGKAMPVDSALTDGGNVALIAPRTNVPGEPIIAMVLDQDALFDDGPRHVSHFVTCPQAAGWRR